VSAPLRLQQAEPLNQGTCIQSQPVVWERLRFAHDDEVAIARALDVAAVAFLPNCAIRLGERRSRKNKAPDFLVLANGKAGILELDGGVHDGRAADDHARDRLFRLATGIRVIERYSREQARVDPHGIVREFLDILARS
jgi:hypothetical protein